MCFGGHLDAIWEDFGKFGTRLTITSFLYRFGADFGFLCAPFWKQFPLIGVMCVRVVVKSVVVLMVIDGFYVVLGTSRG